MSTYLTVKDKRLSQFKEVKLADKRLVNSSQLHCILDSILYVQEMLEESPFTWSESLCEDFASYCDSKQFRCSIL